MTLCRYLMKSWTLGKSETMIGVWIQLDLGVNLVRP